jgi:hypothetical protein
MSYFEDASLVLIPSAVKISKAYAIKPTDGTGDLTFTRSNDTATRIAPNGLIEKVRTNVLLQSNSFDTTWLSNGTTETGGQTGYDGTNNAWLLQRADGLARFLYQTTALSSLSTFSVYAKEGNTDWVFMANGGGENRYFNLGSGTLGAVGTALDSKIEAVGGGWYRCSITISSGAEVRIYPAVGDGAISGLVGANILIQAAQLETGDIATDYIATTTAAVSVGPVANLPRLDYSGGATCPKLLLEPQRTNLITQSEYQGSSDWSKTNVSVTSNAATSPQGVSNATEIVENSSNDQHFIGDNLSLTSGTAYSVSVYAKKNTRSVLQISPSASHIAASYANYDLENGVVSASGGSVTTSIEDAGSGWYRCVFTFTPTSTATATLAFFMQSSTTASRGASYAGDGSSNLYVFGFQVEVGFLRHLVHPHIGSSGDKGG